jgi:hypothetical protein
MSDKGSYVISANSIEDMRYLPRDKYIPLIDELNPNLMATVELLSKYRGVS